MSSLGIYFGPKIISIAQSQGRKILSNIKISRKSISGGELEQKVPEEVMMVALLKDEFRKNKIDLHSIKEVNLSLAGRDLIVRTFDLPPMPRQEIAGAVNFETKKYLPFKAEELISDFQLEFSKFSRKNEVLFMGIKKDLLERYLTMLKQVELKVSNIEYSAFSLLRFLRLSGVGQRGVVGIISMDFQEEEEMNFTVVKDGYPLFSHDITLSAELSEASKPEEARAGFLLDNLKPEIRVSLDYYNRKFPGRNIAKAYLLTSQENRSALETFCRELGLSVGYLDMTRHLGKGAAFSLCFARAYSVSLYSAVRIRPKVNLLAAQARHAQRPVSLKELRVKDALTLFSGLELDFRFVTFGVLVCLLTFFFGLYRLSPLKKELNAVIDKRPAVLTVNPDSKYEELNQVGSDYKKKVNILNDLVSRQVYLSQLLDAIPRAMPEGLWLLRLDFQRQDPQTTLQLKGRVYLASSNKEFDAVNSFISKLKASEMFARYFQEINVVNMEIVNTGRLNLTEFSVSCRGNTR